MNFQKNVQEHPKTSIALSYRQNTYITSSLAILESFPPKEMTSQVQSPMSPDHVWLMRRVPSFSTVILELLDGFIMTLSFFQTYLSVTTFLSVITQKNFKTDLSELCKEIPASINIYLKCQASVDTFRNNACYKFQFQISDQNE